MTIGRLRIMHTPWNIAGHSACLAAAERNIGLNSRNVVLFEVGRGFSADEAYVGSEHDLLRVELARYRLLWRAATQADIISYSFGRSIMLPNAYPDLAAMRQLPLWRWPPRLYAWMVWMRDVSLLHRMGKKIFVTWQGDDARQGRWLRANGRAEVADEAGYYTDLSDRWKQRIIENFSRYATRQYYMNPDLAYVLPSSAVFLPYASFDPASIRQFPPEPREPARPLIVAHAPSHRGIKGTRFIIDAVERLRAEGLPIELTLIEGRSRATALQRYAQADVVVDQLIIGWYGGLAVEAMSLGKPVIAHVQVDDLGFVPADMARELPIIPADTRSIVDVLRHIATLPADALRERGEASRRFVEKWHDPHSVARLTAADYLSA